MSRIFKTEKELLEWMNSKISEYSRTYYDEGCRFNSIMPLGEYDSEECNWKIRFYNSGRNPDGLFLELVGKKIIKEAKSKFNLKKPDETE